MWIWQKPINRLLPVGLNFILMEENMKIRLLVATIIILLFLLGCGQQHVSSSVVPGNSDESTKSSIIPPEEHSEPESFDSGSEPVNLIGKTFSFDENGMLNLTKELEFLGESVYIKTNYDSERVLLRRENAGILIFNVKTLTIEREIKADLPKQNALIKLGNDLFYYYDRDKVEFVLLDKDLKIIKTIKLSFLKDNHAELHVAISPNGEYIAHSTGMEVNLYSSDMIKINSFLTTSDSQYINFLENDYLVAGNRAEPEYTIIDILTGETMHFNSWAHYPGDYHVGPIKSQGDKLILEEPVGVGETKNQVTIVDAKMPEKAVTIKYVNANENFYSVLSDHGKYVTTVLMPYYNSSPDSDVLLSVYDTESSQRVWWQTIASNNTNTNYSQMGCPYLFDEYDTIVFSRIDYYVADDVKNSKSSICILKMN